MRGNRTNIKQNRLIGMVIAIAVFVAAVIIIVCISNNSNKESDIAIGKAYIKTMENKDTTEIENNIFNASRQKMIDELLTKISDDPDIVWRTLTEVNTVLMGDSRVVGFDIFGFMDESHVIAGAGNTIRTVWDSIDTVQVLNPNLLVLSYGINDINNYWVWDTREEWLAELDEIMAKLNEMLPNSYIYVQSIIPATEIGIEDSPSWAQIPDWNKDIKALCQEKGYRYLDIEKLANEHSDLYDIDGVHLQYAFYQYWGEAILMQYLKDSGAL